MIIYIVSDGKPGHLAQTRGLSKALIAKAKEREPAQAHACYEISITAKSWLAKLLYNGKDLNLPKPDLVLCAGHATHLAALSLSRHMHCPCMVCMKPSLPLKLFDLCIMPRHDLPEGKRQADNVFTTNGAINCISPHPELEKKEKLILIGGPSKEYDWDAETVLTQLANITRHSSSPMVLTTSRRTPKDFVQDVLSTCPSIRVEPVETTGPTWVADHLAVAREVWVTQDSVSMVYEALSSGAPVGIIEMTPKGSRAHDRKPSRVARGLSMLIRDKMVRTFTEWARTHDLPVPEHVLNEAGRTADYILERFPKLLS